MNIRLSGLTTTVLFCLLTSHVFATTYTGTKPKDLDITTPTESNTKISEFNNSDREIKTVITNLEGITTVTGTYTVGGTQTTIIGSSTAGFTISFPSASTLATAAIKKKYEIKNINTGTITLNLTVDGVGSPTVSGSQTIHIYTDGTSWYESGARTAQTSGNADYLDNLDSTYYTNATNLATGTVALARIPSTLTGKDADTVDGYHAGTSASRVLVLDASALVPLANIPSTLTGKDADSIDSIDGTNIVQTSRTISTTSPLAGGGALSGNLTLSMPLATSGQNGYISSTDWNTFNNKVSTTVTISTTAPLTGGGDLSSNRTFAMSSATASQDGYLKKEDFQTFSDKANIVAGSGITSSSTTGTTTITNNGVLQIIAGSGISASNNGTGSVTLTSVGTTTAGGWLDTGTASVGSAGYPIIPRGTITVDTAYGITGILDRDIPPTITLDNLTQITTRNYEDLSGTSTIKPTQVAVGTSTLQGAVNVSGTVTASGFSGNGAGITNLSVAFSAVTGSATASQLPLISGLLGSATSAQLPTVLRLYGTDTEQVAGDFGQLYVQSSSSGDGDYSNIGTNTTSIMTSYTAPSPNIVRASSDSINQEAWRAFDRNFSEKWTTSTTTAWLSYDYGTGNAHALYQYNIDSYNDTFAPKNWLFQGSNDNVTWTTLDSQTNQSQAGGFYEYVISVGSRSAYQIYRINITLSNDATYLDLLEMQLIEAYDSLHTQYSAKYDDPVNGNAMFEILTPGTATTKASYIYCNATTTVFGLGTNAAITATSTAYSGWFDGAVRATAFNVASTEKIKENIEPIKIKPDLLDAENIAKQNYIAGTKKAWIVANQKNYEMVTSETGTGSVVIVDTDKMNSDYKIYIELEWVSDLNQDTYTENIQKTYEKGFWQVFDSITPKSWTPKDKPTLTRKGFVVETMPDVVKGDDGQSIDPMALIAYISVVQKTLKEDTIFALSTLKELITTGTVTQQKIDYCNDRLEVLGP